MFHYISRTIHLILTNDGSKIPFPRLGVIGYLFLYIVWSKIIRNCHRVCEEKLQKKTLSMSFCPNLFLTNAENFSSIAQMARLYSPIAQKLLHEPLPN